MIKSLVLWLQLLSYVGIQPLLGLVFFLSLQAQVMNSKRTKKDSHLTQFQKQLKSLRHKLYSATGRVNAPECKLGFEGDTEAFKSQRHLKILLQFCYMLLHSLSFSADIKLAQLPGILTT